MNPADSRFCEHCGAPQELVREPPPAESRSPAAASGPDDEVALTTQAEIRALTVRLQHLQASLGNRKGPESHDALTPGDGGSRPAPTPGSSGDLSAPTLVSAPPSNGHPPAWGWTQRLAAVGPWAGRALTFLPVPERKLPPSSIASPPAGRVGGATGATVPGLDMDWRARARALPGQLRVGATSLQGALFACAVGVYAVTRFWGLQQYPVYFFSDEAYNVVLAQDLINHGLHALGDTFFPMYAERAAQRFIPVGTAYVHILPVLLFGKSVLVTRGTSVVLGILGAIALALILKMIFHQRFWWSAILLLAVTPAWFLHSRTAFDPAFTLSFFTMFLLCYLLYRFRSPNFIFPMVFFGAAAFYTYSAGQSLIGLFVLLALISDASYHWQNRRTVIRALPFAVLLGLPLVGFLLAKPDANSVQLHALGSYWFKDAPLVEKLGKFVGNYLYAMSPQYWFAQPAPEPLAVRHAMQGYGHIPFLLFPFFVTGIVIAVRNFRSPAYRALLIALIATPAAVALVDIEVLRVLSFLVPATLLTALGLEAGLLRLSRNVPLRAVAVAAFAVLVCASAALAHDGVVNGPLWPRDYGLYGVQWGAERIFGQEVPQLLAADPSAKVLVSDTWANDTDTFLPYFLTPSQIARVRIDGVATYIDNLHPLDLNTVFIMPKSDYERMQASGKFKRAQPQDVISCPDGTPCFYVERLDYVNNIAAIFDAEEQLRRQPVTETASIEGESVQVTHPRFDMGKLADAFDGDTFTLARVEEMNPADFDFDFSQPRAIATVAADFGSMDFDLKIDLYAPDSDEPVSYTTSVRGTPPLHNPHVEVPIDQGPALVSRVHLSVSDLTGGDRPKIEVREIAFR